VRLIATSSHKGTPLDQANLTGPGGSFHRDGRLGPAPHCAWRKRMSWSPIPHMPQVESLNAGVAGSIVLYEAARQRRGR